MNKKVGNVIYFLFLLVISFFFISSVKAEIKNVSITSASVYKKTNNLNASMAINSGQVIPSVTFNNLNDYVTYKITIKNTSDDNYSIKEVSDNLESNYIDTSYSYPDVLNANETVDLFLTIKLVKEIDTISLIDDNGYYSLNEFKILFSLENEEGIIISPIENIDPVRDFIKDNGVVEEDFQSSEITNPKTGWNNILLKLLLIICIVVFIIYKTLNKKQIFKGFSFILFLLVSCMCFTINASSKYNLSFTVKKSGIKVKAKVFSISYNNNKTKYINDGKIITYKISTPSKTGYKFLGWTTNKTTNKVDYLSTGVQTNLQIDLSKMTSNSLTISDVWAVKYNPTNNAMKNYFNNVTNWISNESTFISNMTNNFESNNCKYYSSSYGSTGSILCDKPNGYPVNQSENIDVYLYETSTGQIQNNANYVSVIDGKIYNMIPSQTYYWELSSDHSKNGYVTAEGSRRIIYIAGTMVRNFRDLGGLSVDINNDNIYDGTIKYGKLLRGGQSKYDSSQQAIQKLGFTFEVDLTDGVSCESNQQKCHLSKYTSRPVTMYQVTGDNYAQARAAVDTIMRKIVEGENIYFHCVFGADRTGTIAYILEGILGVKLEGRIEDYELTYFYGITNRNRVSSSSFNSLVNSIGSRSAAVSWFLNGSSDETSDRELIDNFRNAVININ